MSVRLLKPFVILKAIVNLVCNSTIRMKVKDAILRTLDELRKPCNGKEIYEYILAHNYCDFPNGETPDQTVQARTGDFIRNGDSRVKRIKGPGRSYLYYLTKFEAEFDLQPALLEVEVETSKRNKEYIVDSKVSYNERDLHKILSSYLKSTQVFSKTIYHEQSLNSKDSHQKWTHPDMVGIRFFKMKTSASQNFLKAINKADTFEIYSYEVKKEINSDSDLKKCFFQAVSNSSWANYGYLVAFEISEALVEEMERLNQSFGIGIIELKANPYESRVLFPAKNKEIDFRTIDKLCNYNNDFERFIEQVEKLMSANEKYVKLTEKELDEFCDSYFINDAEAEAYCKLKGISEN